MAKETKSIILDVAKKLFSEKGYDGCSVDSIADRAKVNKASIYYHFGAKASLYEKVLEVNLERFHSRVVQDIAKQDSPEKKLEAFILTYANNFRGNRDMAPLMLRELASDGAHLSDKTRLVIRGIITEVDKILKEGQRIGIFRQTQTFLPYFMIVGSMNIYTSTKGLRTKFQDNEDEFGFSLSSQETAREIAQIVMNGIKK